MKQFLLISILIFVISIEYANGQNTRNLTGAQILRSARAIYDQGRLHELPVILEDALQGSQLSQSEKVEAYKILILTYIYLEEPAKADNAMIHLLRTDHFFELSESDPVEFQSLYKKFRTKPLFRIGVKAGVNQTLINTLKNYYIQAESQGQGKYSSNLGMQFGLVFEKDFKNFIVAPELFYSSQSFNYKNPVSYYRDPSVGADEEGLASVQHKIMQNRVQLNLMVQHQVIKSRLTPYVSLGPSVAYLLNSTFEGQTFIESRDNISGNPIDNKSRYKSINLSAVASAGVRFKVGGLFVTGDIRYQHGLFNIVNEQNRKMENTPDERRLIRQFAYIDNDFSLSQAMVCVGVQYPFFSPKKLIR